MAAAWQRKVRGEFAIVATDTTGKTHTVKVSALDEKGARKVFALSAPYSAEFLAGYTVEAVFSVVL